MSRVTARARAFLVFAICLMLAPAVAAATKDRVSPEELRSRIQPAADLIDENQFDEAETAFNRIVSSKPDMPPVDRLDLVTAFGVELCTSSRPDTSIPYLRKAVELAGVAFGPQHPETALAYADLGDCLGKSPQTRGGTERENAYRQSYEIRKASLGTDSAETAAAMSALAQFTADRAVEALEPAQVQEASDLFNGAIRRFQALGEDYRPDLEGAMLGRAELAAKSGNVKAAVADFEAVERLAPGVLDFGAVASLDVCEEIDAAFRRQADAQAARRWSSRCSRMRDRVGSALGSLLGSEGQMAPSAAK